MIGTTTIRLPRKTVRTACIADMPWSSRLEAAM
jgi:hypothetical protein